MPVSNITLQSLKDLPDEAVLTDEQTSLLFNFSKDTLRRLDKTGHGPPVVKLSPRRKGRTVGGLRNWLQTRIVVPVSAPDGGEASQSKKATLGKVTALHPAKPVKPREIRGSNERDSCQITTPATRFAYCAKSSGSAEAN